MLKLTPKEQKLLDNLPAFCNILRRLAIEAGEITMKYFDGLEDAQAQTKADGSPVSLADQEAEALIEKTLAELTPNIPMVGEEAFSEGRIPNLQEVPYFWLVDPLDGTREFMSGGEDFTVNIALIHNGRPLLGIVYVPVSEVLYAGHGAGTAVRWSADSGKDKKIHVRDMPKGGLVVVASKSHGSRDKLDKFLEGYKVNKVIQRGSSLKICVIAEGKADLYPRFGPTCEWDTAAGHAVLMSAGGFLTDVKGTALGYGGADPKFLNPEFIASGFEWSIDKNAEV